MAMIQRSWTTPQTNLLLVEGEAGKIIVVKRVLFNTEQQGWLRLMDDPEGEVIGLLPAWHLAARRELDIELGERYGVSGSAGKGLGITTSTTTSPAAHSLVMWYELVNAG